MWKREAIGTETGMSWEMMSIQLTTKTKLRFYYAADFFLT